MYANKSTSKQSVELVSKMTPEMCRAIKRQETNSGLDYWRTGFSNIKVSSDNTGLQVKKPTYRRLTQVNSDFPGLFLPNVDTESLRQKRKDPVILNRAKTSLSPEIKARHISGVRQKSDNYNSSKKASLTDLTCLQLADTLLTYKTPFSDSIVGVYNPPSLRSRYMELFFDNKNWKDNEEQQNKCSKETNMDETEEENKISIFSYHTYKPKDKSSNEGQFVIVSPCNLDLPVVDISASAQLQTKPQKSILKNGLDKISRPSSETAIPHTYLTSEKSSICSYQLPGRKEHLRSALETRLPICSLYPKIQNDLHDFGHIYGYRNSPVKHERTGAVRNIPIKLEKEHSSEFTDLTTRKRSVRFNAAHEIREYTPCEPIGFC